ncbi:hypothetical protein UY3_15752 [Chelonia mydas]|uniref:HAT C-terminal dimerisation domain-containing protein n=1 Tax=Chelonia mydas TaxID=8469 RepID=M7B4T9_CHEMY|nr:hypothetical protein UY3_15752 [Chelonia mydas]
MDWRWSSVEELKQSGLALEQFGGVEAEWIGVGAECAWPTIHLFDQPNAVRQVTGAILSPGGPVTVSQVRKGPDYRAEKRVFRLHTSGQEDSGNENEHALVHTALDCYRAEPVISMDACPLEWWLKHEGTYESLACLACKYFAMPAITVL